MGLERKHNNSNDDGDDDDDDDDDDDNNSSSNLYCACFRAPSTAQYSSTSVRLKHFLMGMSDLTSMAIRLADHTAWPNCFGQ